jgi:hypothetical protein
MTLPLSKTYLSLVKTAQIYHAYASNELFDPPIDQLPSLQVIDLILPNLHEIYIGDLRRCYPYGAKDRANGLRACVALVRREVYDVLLTIPNLYDLFTEKESSHSLSILWTVQIDPDGDIFVRQIVILRKIRQRSHLCQCADFHI